MSAYVVDKTHIDALLTAGLTNPPAAYYHGDQRHEITHQTAGTIGAMLWAENVRSVNYRYQEDEWEQVYELTELDGTIKPLIVLKAISCYEHQSCEHPEWEQSEAHAFCRALQDRMIGQLPGYDDAPGWEISDPRVFFTPTPR
jgi:hypothetical protein